HLGRAVLLNPFDAAPLTALARTYLELDSPEMAIRTIQEALALNAGDAEIHRVLGDAYRLDRYYPLAAECYERALARDPRPVPAAHGLARSYIQIDRLGEAADVLNHLVDNGCRDAAVLLTLCRLPSALVRVDLLNVVDSGVRLPRNDDGGRLGFLRAKALHLR